MEDYRLMRLPISGTSEPTQFFNFRVIKNGSRALDVKLQGTDGDAAFLAKRKGFFSLGSQRPPDFR
jgi:hypothetical protein